MKKLLSIITLSWSVLSNQNQATSLETTPETAMLNTRVQHRQSWHMRFNDEPADMEQVEYSERPYLSDRTWII